MNTLNFSLYTVLQSDFKGREFELDSAVYSFVTEFSNHVDPVLVVHIFREVYSIIVCTPKQQFHSTINDPSSNWHVSLRHRVLSTTHGKLPRKNSISSSDGIIQSWVIKRECGETEERRKNAAETYL